MDARDLTSALEPGEDNERMNKKLRERGMDSSAAYAAFNRGDNAAVEQFLADIAPPPREEVAVLERRINTALDEMRAIQARALKNPASDNRYATTPQQRPRERRATSRARSRSPGGDQDSEPPALALPHDLAARLTFLSECLEDGDVGTGAAIVLDLLDELRPSLARGRARCRFCGLTDWGGLIERHERTVHAHEVLDLKEQRTR